MSGHSSHIAALLIVAGALGMTSCAGGSATTSTRADFYWSAARETYGLGDYAKTANHLEHLIGDQNAYTARAIPWYLVITAGMTNGYIELAEQQAAGARHNKAAAAAFRSKAAAYRTMASQWAMRFAQNADKLQDIPLGALPLRFGLPKGNAAEPELLGQIADGVELSAADAETAEVLTLQRAVLMAACRAAGAPQDVAKATEILGQPLAEVPRAVFGQAIADMLKAEAALYTRNKLDEPEKLAAMQARAEMAAKEAARVGSARFVPATGVAQVNH